MDRVERDETAKNGRRTTREWRACLQRLRAWHADDDALADRLPITKGTMRQAYNNEDGTRHIGSDTMETIIELHDKIERRPEYADRLCLNVLQTMEVIEDQLLTPEQLAVIETRWERLKERVENLHDLLTDTTPDQ